MLVVQQIKYYWARAIISDQGVEDFNASLAQRVKHRNLNIFKRVAYHQQNGKLTQHTILSIVRPTVEMVSIYCGLMVVNRAVLNRLVCHRFEGFAWFY